MKVFDTDAHVEECDETFAALPADIRPRIIEGEKRAFWLIEGRTFPRLQGKEARLQSVKTEFAKGFVDIVEELRCSGFDLGSTPW